MSMSCDISAAKQLVCQSNCNNPNCKLNPQSEASQCLHGQNQKPPLSNLSHHMGVLLGTVWHAHTRAGGRNTRKPPTPNTCKERSEPTTTEQTTTLRRPYGYDMNALPQTSLTGTYGLRPAIKICQPKNGQLRLQTKGC